MLKTLLKRYFLICALALFWMPATAKDYVAHVNPLMGTLSSFELSAGNVYPATALPWGMHCWTPRTARIGDGWQYTYTKNRIFGFEQTHQPSPWINDYGQFSLMPITGEVKTDESQRASWFSHKAEVSQPHYYKVYLADYDITTEIAPTERAAMFRFTFPEATSRIVIDAYDGGSNIQILPEQRRIAGYSTRNSGGVPEGFRCYFVIEFDKDFNYVATLCNDSLTATSQQPAPLRLINGTTHQTGNHTGAVIGFNTRRGEVVHARVASSFISEEQAELNLKELGMRSFDEVVKDGRQQWNNVLGRIEVNGGTPEQLRTFYSCLYRSLLFPRKFYEIDAEGNAIHYSPYNGKVLPGKLYTDTGFWDTFRCLFPLLNLVYPSVNAEIQEGLLNAYKESGFFPEWASPGHRDCMIGNNSASVVADALLKGIGPNDVATLYEGLQNGARNVHPKISSTGRKGHEYYNQLGYIPCDVGINENAARTLEYAYNDWCILQVARALNRPQAEIQELEQRAGNYQHLFNPQYRLMCGKRKDGTFEENFSPLKWGGNFTEGNSWHYTWSVFHDVQGLIDLMGGRDCFVEMLDSVFTTPPQYDDSYYGFPIHEIREMTVMNMGNYAHGNQPIQHAIYLYNHAGYPWKAQQRIREVMERMYSPTPDGYPGDEDNGQTSAWYVFSALGFYPVCPGSNEYVMGTPLFQNAVVHLENGKDLIIEAPQNSTDHLYIQKAEWNGNNHPFNFLKYENIMQGGTLHIQLGTKPNLQRGTRKEDAPYSMTPITAW